MKMAHDYPSGTFNAKVKKLRKKENRYILVLELEEMEVNEDICIDIDDSIFETAGTCNFSASTEAKLRSSFPSTIKVLNKNGYWEIQNEAQLLSDVLSKVI